MTYKEILQSLDDGILTLTLNRPDKLNAYTALMGQQLARAFESADRDDAVRVIIVTGAGRGFCAGADISGGASSFGDEQGGHLFGDDKASTRSDGNFIEAMFNCRKPSIAAINGAAVGSPCLWMCA